MPDSSASWTLLLSLTALLLSVAVLAQIASRYTAAYLAAPHEVATFLDAVDSSIAENESYDRDVARVQRLEDKLRLGRLLREIQRGSDDLREHLNALLAGDDDARLRLSARLLWAAKRVDLEGQLRRLDLMRMRFLVIYMGVVAGASVDPAGKQPREKESAREKEREREKAKGRDPEKRGLHLHPHHESARQLPRALTEAIKEEMKTRPPLRRLTTQTIGHQETTAMPHRTGWAGVVKELQLSPRMHLRHASIERSMSVTPSKESMPATPITPITRTFTS